MPQLRLIVKGRVQGVGFRFFASRTANSLGLKGFVRNLPDNSVEILAQGSREMLERLVERIRDGPITAKVEEVKTEWQEESKKFDSFGIRF